MEEEITINAKAEKLKNMFIQAFQAYDEIPKKYSFNIINKFYDGVEQTIAPKLTGVENFKKFWNIALQAEPDEIIVQELNNKGVKEKEQVIKISETPEPEDQKVKIEKISNQFEEMKNGLNGMNGLKGLPEYEKQIIDIKHQMELKDIKTQNRNLVNKNAELEQTIQELENENEELEENVNKLQEQLEDIEKANKIGGQIGAGIQGILGIPGIRASLQKTGLGGIVSALHNPEAIKSLNAAEQHEGSNIDYEETNIDEKKAADIQQISTFLLNLDNEKYNQMCKILIHLADNKEDIQTVFDLINK